MTPDEIERLRARRELRIAAEFLGAFRENPDMTLLQAQEVAADLLGWYETRLAKLEKVMEAAKPLDRSLAFDPNWHPHAALRAAIKEADDA